MNVAFVGFGEVGRIYAQALHDAGVQVGRICDTHMSDAGRAVVSRIGAPAEDAVGPWLCEHDVVFSAVTGGVALDVIRLLLPHMRTGALLVDMTTAAPDQMKQAAALAREAEVAFVDVGILGAVSIRKGATALVAAGDGAQAFRPLASRLGAPLKLLPGEAGDAVRLKLLRSVFTKGIEALAVETLIAAERQGLRDEFFDIISDIDETPLRQFLEVLVRSHVVHAARRHHEVCDAGVQLKRLGIEPLVTQGVEELFHRTASAPRGDASGDLPTIEAAIEWLYATARSAPDVVARTG